MKKSLLFALLALSMNAFPQNQQPASNTQENARDIMEHAGKILPANCFILNPNQPITRQTPENGSFVRIYDSIYRWQWDTTGIAWKIKSRVINMVYDAKNNLSRFIDQNWSGLAWVNSNKMIFQYNASNSPVSQIQQNWNGIDWVNYYQVIYTYDASNNMTSELQQSWNGSVWENVVQYIYTYDVSNNLTLEIIQNAIGGSWVNFSQFIYTYDANHNDINYLQKSWNGTSWDNFYKYLRTFDPSNNVISELKQSWIGGTWANTFQTTSTYNANNHRTSSLGQNWNGGSWVNTVRYTFIYDAGNNLTNSLCQSWIVSTWVNSWQYLTTYDANNFAKSEVFKEWNSTSSGLDYADSSYYYFHTIIGIDELVGQKGGVIISPNPTTGKFTVSSMTSIGSIEIYNLTGERIYSDFQSSQQIPVDLSGRGKGIYLLKINCGSKTYTRKIIVQ